MTLMPLVSFTTVPTPVHPRCQFLLAALLSFAAFWVSATSDQWQERDEWEASHPSGCTTGTPHHVG